MFDRPRLLPTDHNDNVNTDIIQPIIYQNNAQFAYEQNYRNLKNYTFLQQTQPPDYYQHQPMPFSPTRNNPIKLSQV